MSKGSSAYAEQRNGRDNVEKKRDSNNGNNEVKTPKEFVEKLKDQDKDIVQGRVGSKLAHIRGSIIISSLLRYNDK